VVVATTPWVESMRIGVVFPQTELGGDPGAVRAFATAASELGSNGSERTSACPGTSPAAWGGRRLRRRLRLAGWSPPVAGVVEVTAASLPATTVVTG